jgi:hypothetical protein
VDDSTPRSDALSISPRPPRVSFGWSTPPLIKLRTVILRKGVEYNCWPTVVRGSNSMMRKAMIAQPLNHGSIVAAEPVDLGNCRAIKQYSFKRSCSCRDDASLSAARNIYDWSHGSVSNSPAVARSSGNQFSILLAKRRKSFLSSPCSAVIVHSRPRL